MNKPIPILFIDHTPFAGGAQLVLAEHLAQLDKKRYAPIVACTNTIPQLLHRYEQAGAKVIVIPLAQLKGNPITAVWRLGQSVWAVRQLILSKNIPLVVANSTRASYVATLAVLGTRTKLIWWVRDFLYNKFLFRLLKWRVATIICVSQAIKNFYMDSQNPQGQVVYVASNIHTAIAQLTPAAIAAERRKWGIAKTDIVVGFMGRLVDEKGPADLITAVQSLEGSYPQLKALIVGTGRGQQHDVEDALKRQAHHDTAIIFTGYQTQEALYYACFDLFVLTTRDAEPFATTVVQAMMATKPVIATNVGGTPELVVNNHTGILIEPNQPDQLAKAIARLIDQPAIAHQLGQAGYTQVMAHHTEDQATAQLQQLYASLLSL